MAADVQQFFHDLSEMLMQHVPPLQVRVNEPQHLELAGTKPAMQGKKKVDGYYFASLVMKPKDVRLYFFPVYTHVEEFALPEQLGSCLKGKSCFHIKSLNGDLANEIRSMLGKGITLYQKDDLI